MESTELKRSTRQGKQSLDYITVIDTMQRKMLKIDLGLIGIAIYDELLMVIKNNIEGGYWINWDKRTKNVFKHENGISEAQLNEAIDYFFEEDIFSKEMFDKYGILTSSESQKNWLICASKRPRFEEGIKDEYFLISPEPYIEYNRNRYKKNSPSKNTNDVDNGDESDIIGITDLATPAVEVVEEIEEENSILEIAECVKIENLHDVSTINVKMSTFKHENVSNLQTSVAERSVAEHSIAKQSVALQEQISPHTEEASKEVGGLGHAIRELLNSEIQKIDANVAINTFEQESCVEPKSENKPENHKKSANSKKTKKLPHPSRAQIIEIWEKESGYKYVQDAKNNIAIVNLINNLEPFSIKLFGENSAENVSKAFQWIYDNKHKLPDFYKNNFLIDFPSIAGNFVKITTKILQNNNDKSSDYQEIKVSSPVILKMIEIWNNVSTIKYSSNYSKNIENIAASIENQLNKKRYQINDQTIISHFQKLITDTENLNDYQKGKIITSLKLLDENFEEIFNKVFSKSAKPKLVYQSLSEFD